MIIKDSITLAGARVTTFQLRYPRFIHGEFLTHRMFSRNSSSSRAIPASKYTNGDIYVPKFQKNKRGMQGGEHLDVNEQMAAELFWNSAFRALFLCSAFLNVP